MSYFGLTVDKFLRSTALRLNDFESDAGKRDGAAVIEDALERNEAFVKDAEVVMTTAPYRQLVDVKEGDSEAAGPGYSS